MTGFNRRRFLQIAGAAGLAPALPSISTAGAATAKGLTNAQKLWVSLYANAEKTASLPSLTRSMGISSQAAKGVYARLIQTQAIAAHSAVNIARSNASLQPTPTQPVSKISSIKTDMPTSIKPDMKKLVTDQIDLMDTDEVETDVDPKEISET